MTVDRCIRFHNGVFAVRVCRRVNTVKVARELKRFIANYTGGNNVEFYEDRTQKQQIVQTYKTFQTYKEAKMFRNLLEKALRENLIYIKRNDC